MIIYLLSIYRYLIFQNAKYLEFMLNFFQLLLLTKRDHKLRDVSGGCLLGTLPRCVHNSGGSHRNEGSWWIPRSGPDGDLQLRHKVPRSREQPIAHV